MSYFLRTTGTPVAQQQQPSQVQRQHQQQPINNNTSPTHSATSTGKMSAYSPLNHSSSNNNTAHNSPVQATSNKVVLVQSPVGQYDPYRAPIFNDRATHDIVIVAAGDRGLSGSHNEQLQQHTQHGGCSNERERSLSSSMQQQQQQQQQRRGISPSSTGEHHDQQFHMEFYAHKEVLAACSPFFRAFLIDDLIQKELNAADGRNVTEEQQQQQQHEPCRRLVVHNVLPASLAHVLQSMYGAYSNGAPADVRIYDPVALSAASASVIICAWELAMKLELRPMSAAVAHILIPLISADNALELLKATTKYDHELSIVLQRACLAAHALPPSIRSEADRRLWQELCSQIPWLASAVAHMDDEDNNGNSGRRTTAAAQNLKGRNRAAQLLAARSQQQHRDRRQHGSDDDDEINDENNGGGDRASSVGESTQRAWDETNSQFGELGGGVANDADEDAQQYYGDDGDQYNGNNNDDEEFERKLHRQQQQQQAKSNNINRVSRLTPAPLSSVEAMCLRNDRTGSAQQPQHQQQQRVLSSYESRGSSAQQHQQIAPPPPPATTTTTTQLSLRPSQGSKPAPFIPAGSTATAATSKLHHVDPAPQIAARSGKLSIATALHSSDPIIRVTATRNVLRDAMARSGSQQQHQHQLQHSRGAVPPTADLPFQQHSSPSSSSAVAAVSGRFVQRALPDFEQRFVHQIGDHHQQRTVSKLATAPVTTQKVTTSNYDQEDNNNNTPIDATLARHKIASLEKDIQNTYDIYSTEMADYRNAYEALRRETTELWAATGLVDAGNVPSAVDIAEQMLDRVERDAAEEQRARAELNGALTAVAAQVEEEQQFGTYAEQFLRASGIAAEELGDVIHQLRSLADQYNNNAAAAAADNEPPAKRAERQRTMRRAVELHLDELVRRVADEDREQEAKLRAHELTLQQLMVDVEEEQRRLQMVKLQQQQGGAGNNKNNNRRSSRRS